MPSDAEVLESPADSIEGMPTMTKVTIGVCVAGAVIFFVALALAKPLFMRWVRRGEARHIY